MPRRTFSPSQVQALIPALEQIFGQLTLVAEAITNTESRIARVEGQPDPALAAELEAKMQLAKMLVTRVNEMGGEVKDLQQGLVDFPWRKGGKTVCLCWQYGEKHLGFWHSEEEGFGGRKALTAAPPVSVELLN